MSHCAATARSLRANNYGSVQALLPPQIGVVAAWFRKGQGIAADGSQWDDASGNGRHLKQATGANRPTKQADGSLLFNLSHWLKTDAFTLPQPVTVFIVVEFLSHGTRALFDGNTAASDMVYQDGTSPAMLMQSGGTAVASGISPSLNTLHVIAFVLNGASSLMQLDANAPVTGTVGTTALGGITVGARADGNVPIHAKVHEIVMYSAALAALPRAQASDYGFRVGAMAYPAALTATSPQSYQTFQRTAGQTTGPIIAAGVVTGDYQVAVAFNGATPQSITAASVSGGGPGTYSGSATGLAQGQGTCIISTRNGRASITRTNVGIGNVFAIAGQSNAGGMGTNNQVWVAPAAAPGLIATMHASDGISKVLADPIDTAVGQIASYSASNDALILNTPGGSVWPLVATDVMAATLVPFDIIPCPLGGSGIGDWASGQPLFNELVARILAAGGVKATLFWQGEKDAIDGMAKATYKTAFSAFADALYAATGSKVMPCKLQNCTGISAGNLANIRDAVGELMGTGNVLLGPDLSGLTTDDTLHLMSDANLAAAAALWSPKILAIL